MKERTIATHTCTFHALEAGSGPLVLCLHGFPDHARSYRHQLPALAAAGFHAVAPTMRGIHPTGPAPDGRYDTAALGEDVVALLDALDASEAIVVGHDWGAVATYTGTLMAGPRVTKLVGMAVPYGSHFLHALANDYAQQRRSWYMFFFQQALADHALAANDFALLDGLWADWSPGWTCPPEERAALKATFRQGDTVTNALAYYRHSMGPVFANPAIAIAAGDAMSPPIGVPAMVIHGARDGCIGADLVAPMASYFPAGLRTEIVPDAGHFVHQEKPDLVNRLLLEFLRG